MCGIIGYTGKSDAKEIMLDALELLEYRGYDSAGIALLGDEGTKIWVSGSRYWTFSTSGIYYCNKNGEHLRSVSLV